MASDAATHATSPAEAQGPLAMTFVVALDTGSALRLAGEVEEVALECGSIRFNRTESNTEER